VEPHTTRADELAAELGVAAATDPAALARECDVDRALRCGRRDVLAVVDALLPGLRAGALVIDCSTVSATRHVRQHAGWRREAPNSSTPL